MSPKLGQIKEQRQNDFLQNNTTAAISLEAELLVDLKHQNSAENLCCHPMKTIVNHVHIHAFTVLHVLYATYFSGISPVRNLSLINGALTLSFA